MQMSKITIGVRGVNESVYLRFKALAVKKGVTVGEELTAAMKERIRELISQDHNIYLLCLLPDRHGIQDNHLSI